MRQVRSERLGDSSVLILCSGCLEEPVKANVTGLNLLICSTCARRLFLRGHTETDAVGPLTHPRPAFLCMSYLLSSVSSLALSPAPVACGTPAEAAVKTVSSALYAPGYKPTSFLPSRWVRAGVQ